MSPLRTCRCEELRQRVARLESCLTFALVIAGTSFDTPDRQSALNDLTDTLKKSIANPI